MRSNIVFYDHPNVSMIQNFDKRPTWMINQWWKTSHIFHFSFKMVPTGIIFNMREKYGIPKNLETIFWQDYNTTNFSPFEKDIYDIALSHGRIHIKRNLFSNFKKELCFKSVYTSQKPGRFAYKPEQLINFQKYAEKKFRIVNTVYKSNRINKFLPLKAVFITRNEGNGNRKILGYEIIKRILLRNNISLVQKTISSQNSTLVQANVFNSYGLIITPHSSQLANLLFAQKNAIVLIIAPFLFEDVYIVLANLCGLRPMISIGHSSTGNDFDKPSCLISKHYNAKNCYKTWRQSLGYDTILNQSIIEHDLKIAIKLLKQTPDS